MTPHTTILSWDITCAAKSIWGKSVSSIASAVVGTICVNTAVLTKMEAFIAFMNLCTSEH